MYMMQVKSHVEKGQLHKDVFGWGKTGRLTQQLY